MIGPFGEVLVMDWGLSKLLGTAASARHLTEPEENKIREGGSEEGTAHGSVLGTPGSCLRSKHAGMLFSMNAPTFTRWV